MNRSDEGSVDTSASLTLGCDRLGERRHSSCPVAAAVLRERERLLERHTAEKLETDHRFLNNLQMVSSMLVMQSRAAASTETASALADAAARVSMIGRVHRLLHSLDAGTIVNFKRFVQALSRDLTDMIPAAKAMTIAVEGADLELPSTLATPFGFVANELLTNAIKYGNDPITVRVEGDAHKGAMLSVENDGPPLPRDFDPARSKGLGMLIVRSFVASMGGTLAISRGKNDNGARFAVLLSQA